MRIWAIFPLAALLSLAALPAAAAAGTVPATGATATIAIELKEGKLRFSGPPTVTRGDQLQIVNLTNPRQVGPVTFSLVARGALPRTRRARRNCGEPGHLCATIAGWHGVTESGEVTRNPAEAGAPGWSTMGSARRPGDSWLSTSRGESFSQQVTANGGTTLYFMCAIHPWLQGRIEVLAPPETVLPSG